MSGGADRASAATPKARVLAQDRLRAATATESLGARAASNDKYSSVDFQGWLLSHLEVAPGWDVLDVGCGTGAQALSFLDLAGSQGSVSCIDVSADSVDALSRRAEGAPNLQAIAADMGELGTAIESRFRVTAFDLAHSTYAIYYAANPTLVLDAMRAALKPAGRLAVCVPAPGHGLVRFMDSFIALPEEVRAGDAFAPDVLQPYFDSHFSSVTAQKLRNVVRIPSVAEVLGFLSHTSYYAEAVRAPVEAAIEARIRAHGHFEYEKNSVLLIGRNG